MAGTVFFATNTPITLNPDVGICTNLGEALGYAVDPFTGMPALNRDGSTSGGMATYTAADYATKFSVGRKAGSRPRRGPETRRGGGGVSVSLPMPVMLSR